MKIEDKKLALKEAAHQVFLRQGYKETNVAAIAKNAGIAVGSFYKYYPSKEEIFIEIYEAENEMIRNTIINKINWDGEPVDVIDELFTYSITYTSNNKILSEWSNPAIADKLHDYYLKEKNSENYAFHHFLVEAFRERLAAKQFDAKLTEKLLKVYDLIYFIDCHVTDDSFEGYSEALWTLVKYFIKGVFTEN
ncbi:TetR/AcrR family transcriptional regulator [Enterococcus olivae]